MNELNLSSYIQIMRAGLKIHDKQESAGVFLLDAINKQEYVIAQSYWTGNLNSKKISRLVSRDDPVPDGLRQASTIQNVIDNTIDYFQKEVIPDLNPHLKDDTIDKFVKLIDIDTTIPDSKKKSLMVFHETGEDARFLAEIFLYALNRPNKKQNNTVDRNETSNPAISSTSPIPHSNKPVTIPATSVYYDEADGKIHIGNIGISIPKELAPPKDIAPEEEIYVRELLAAYADEKKTGILTLADLDSLPQKYKQNFSDQRINYYSAVRIDRFVRNSIEGGEKEADNWKSGTLDYIIDTVLDDYDNGYKRLVAVMKKVVDSSTTSVVSSFKRLVGAKEKKGVCHLLINDGKIKWVYDDG